jgi:hypothetical protein
MATSKKELYIIDPQDIFDPFYYVVPTSWRAADQKWAYEDIIAPAGLTEYREAEYQTIRRRGLLPRLGATTGDRDVDFATQVASCCQAIRDMDKLIALKVKGVYWGEHEKGTTAKDVQEAERYRGDLTVKLRHSAKMAVNYILDWERALAYLAAWKLTDPAKTLAYIRKCADKMKLQYDLIVATQGKVPDGVGRLKWDHILGKTDEEIITWMAMSIVFEPEDAHGRDKSYPLTPDCVTGKVFDLKRWLDAKAAPPKTLGAALTAFDLAAPPKPAVEMDSSTTKKRSHTKKKAPVPTHLLTKPEDDPRFGTIGGQPSDQVSFEDALESLTWHYRGRCQEAKIPDGVIPVIAGPIYFTMGEFRYDTTWETRHGSPVTIPLDQLTVEQADTFQMHLEAFDVAFQRYLEENTRLNARATLSKGIMTFMRAKKAA